MSANAYWVYNVFIHLYNGRSVEVILNFLGITRCQNFTVPYVAVKHINTAACKAQP